MRGEQLAVDGRNYKTERFENDFHFLITDDCFVHIVLPFICKNKCSYYFQANLPFTGNLIKNVHMLVIYSYPVDREPEINI